MEEDYLNKFEHNVNRTLAHFLYDKGAVDNILPDTTDIEQKWEKICMAYLNDGVREFNQYPTVSLGWMMYIGMAVAKMWDEDWDTFGKIDELYTGMRDVRGYDALDDYISEDILKLDKAQTEATAHLVGEAATKVYNLLMHEGFEPGTPAAFNAYVRCLHQLYYFGAAIELKRLGYHMVEYNPDTAPASTPFDPIGLN